MTITRRAIAAVAIAVSALSGCGSSTKSTAPASTVRRSADRSTTVPTTGAPSAQSPARTSVSIKGFAFHPATLKIKTGMKVSFVNNDGEYHTVTADKSSPVAFDSGHVPPGDAKGYSFTFTTPGTYQYHCSIHPSMSGIVDVS